MEIETVLIKLILIICGAIIMGTLIYGITILPMYKFLKKALSVILVLFFTGWMVNLFMGSDFISDWITTWIRHLITKF